MYRLIKGVVSKYGIILSDNLHDDYTQLHARAKLRYSVTEDELVNTVIRPCNNQWWIDPEKRPELWLFDLEQHVLPKWFDTAIVEARLKKAFDCWRKEHVLIDMDIDELSSGYYWLIGCRVNLLRQNVQVKCYDTSIQTMCGRAEALLYGRSSIHEMKDFSMVHELRDDSHIHYMFDHSLLKKMRDDSSIHFMGDYSKVLKTSEFSRIKCMQNRSKVHTMTEHSLIYNMYDKAAVRKMKNATIINGMCSEAKVIEMWERSCVAAMGFDTSISEMHHNALARDLRQYPKMGVLRSN